MLKRVVGFELEARSLKVNCSIYSPKN